MTIKQNGGVFGRNPTFNDVTIEGQLTFDGDIDVSSDLTVDGTLKADAVRVGDIAPSYSVLSSARNAGGSFEWGHSNSSGYPSTMGAEGGSGSPYIAFNAGPGTNSNTYKTLGILGTVIKTDTSGNLRIGRLTTASADNQTPVESAVFTNNGNLQFPSGQGIDFSPTAGTGTSELFDDYEEGTWTPVFSDASSGGNTATGSAYGYYIKVGGLVYVTGQFENVTTTGMTGGNLLYVQGIPYTPTSVGNDIFFMGSVKADGVTNSGFVSVESVDNFAWLRFAETNGATGGHLTVSDFASGTADIFFSLCYRSIL